MDAQQHQQLALWAADCADRVLTVFEQAQGDDNRPRCALAAARAWAQGELSVSEARKFAFAAHAAARAAASPAAVAAARAAGHAAATAHVATHARHASAYALKAAPNPVEERSWQLRHAAQCAVTNGLG